MRALYDSKSKLDDRGIKKLLTEESKVETWLKVEAALATAQAQVGIIPQEAADNIVANAKIENIDFEKMAAIKAKIGHGFVPFLKTLLPHLNEEGQKYLHFGATTQNIQQTSQLYQIHQIYEILYSFLGDILENLAKLAEDNAETVMAGRTHGKHAIPITYGYKVSVYISELLSNIERMRESEKRICAVMMGGAIGSFNAMGEKGRQVQSIVADLLGMSEMDVPSRNMCQHKEEYIMTMALLCNTFHKMAEEVYYTGIEEFSEVSEAFTPGTVGSSTMPQKINPKLAKGIIANSQKLYSIIPTGLYSGVRMFEGDSSSYMLFDGLMEEATELMVEVIIRAEELTRTLTVKKENMLRNVMLNKGLDNSEYVMMKVAEKIGKDKAHTLLYDKAMQVEIEGKNYYDVLKEDETISSLFTDQEIKDMIDPKNYVGVGPELARELALKARKMSGELR